MKSTSNHICITENKPQFDADGVSPVDLVGLRGVIAVDAVERGSIYRGILLQHKK